MLNYKETPLKLSSSGVAETAERPEGECVFDSVLKAPPHKWLLLAVVWELALITVLIQVPSIRSAFGIIPPSFSDLRIIAAFGLVVFLSMEIVKALLRRQMRMEKRSAVEKDG